MESLKALQIASKNLITVESNEPVKTAHELMRERRIRHLAVIEKGDVIGVVSDRDVMKALHLEIATFFAADAKNEKFDETIKVKNVMSWPIKSVSENAPLIDVVDKMLEQKISSLLVTRDDSKVVGIVTTDDLLGILKKYLKDEHTEFWGESLVNNFYATPIRTILEVLSNTGI